MLTQSNSVHTKWNASQKQHFIDNINTLQIENMLSELQLKDEGSLNQYDIDLVSNRLSETFIETAQTTFASKPAFTSNKHKHKWYGQEC